MEDFSIYLTSSVSFINVLYFSVYKSFTSLVKFVDFDAVIKGIAFLISLSDSTLLIHKNETDFCMSILYPATLLSSFICSNKFLVESLRISICKIMSNKDNLTASFPIWMAFISFSCLIALARTSSIMGFFFLF